jgi:hypothetical protein
VFVWVFVFVYKCRPDCPASDQSGTGIKKTNDAGTVPVSDQAKAVQHFSVRYRTEIIDAGMPMPALVFWMPMHTYDFGTNRRLYGLSQIRV